MDRYTIKVIETIKSEKTPEPVLPKWKVRIAKWLKIPVPPPLFHYNLNVVVDNHDIIELNDMFLYGGGRLCCVAKWPFGKSDCKVALVTLTPMEDDLDLTGGHLIMFARAFKE